MNRALPGMLAALCVALQGATARAQEPTDPRDAELTQLHEAVEKLEKRIDELESARASEPAPSSSSSASVYGSGDRPGSWADRVRLSGSASLDYLSGQSYGLFKHGAMNVWDTRLFVDADLARDVKVGDATAFRDAGFTFEWNLARLGYLANNVGDVYVDFRNIADESLLNFQAGRFQIPFGENYLRFGRGIVNDPFVALSAPPPWFWDEGVKLWGTALEGKVGYAFSVTDGEGGFNGPGNGSQQLSLKLAADPTEWLHLSVSGLRTGVLGTNTSPAFAAVWLGEMIPAAFGSGSPVQSFQSGEPVGPGPNKLSNLTIVGADAIFKLAGTRLWLSYGDARIDSAHSTFYDRSMIYWLAELVYHLNELSPRLGGTYVALRGSGMGTYSDSRGYLYDFRYGNTIGYNMSSFDQYALALGVPIGDHVLMKVQYAIQKIGLVHGITDPDIKEHADDNNFFGAEIGVHF